MRCILILTFVLLYSTASAQIVNSVSKNKTGFYTHALDSALSIIKQNKTLRTVYVVGRECVKAYIPDTLQNIPIKWAPPSFSKKKKAKKLKADEMVISISCLAIIRDEVSVGVMTALEGDWLYVFQYYYQPDTMEYKLKNVKRGM
jgi:hypothetical protein